ncbi:DUF2723 domain-containing protein [Candidatus Curtissbacteria bacterium]|nr:DUF2723 domain-containing protein [Candidatus Curtissbacteria bacterium]
MKLSFTKFIPVPLLLFAFLVYWYTKPPSILWIDSGTMIAASASLGIPNPPGFPFYMLASHLATLVPLGNILTRLEAFTIVFSLWLLFLVYQIILLILKSNFSFHKANSSTDWNTPGVKAAPTPGVESASLGGSTDSPTSEVKAASTSEVSLGDHSNSDTKFSIFNFQFSIHHLSALFGTIALAFSYQYWSQSQNTEAFIFSYSFVALFAYLLIRLESFKGSTLARVEPLVYGKRVFKTFLLIAFLYGLAAGANPTVASMVPGVLFVMFLERKYLTIPKLAILGLVFVITISAVYSYLPLRAKTWPFVNWGNPQTPKLFLDHLHGAGLNINEPGPGGSVNGFTGSPLVFAQSASYFFLNSAVQFTPVLVPFILFGMYYVYKKNRYLFGFLVWVPTFDLIYSGLYLSGNQESWFILAWMFLAIFIGIGFYYLGLKILVNGKGNEASLGKGEKVRSKTSNLTSKLNGHPNPNPTTNPKLLALFSLSFLPLIVFFPILNRSNHNFSSDYWYNLYTPLEKNAIIIGTGDFFDSVSHYLHVGDVYRKDVTPVTANVFYVNKWNRDTLRHATNLSISDKLESMIQYKSFTEYNEVMNQFIAENIDNHPIYVDHLTLRASALAGTTAGQLRLDERFKFLPYGLSLKVVRAQEKIAPNLALFDFQFKSPIEKPPFYLERNYRGAERNILNDYVYAYEYLADWYAENGKGIEALKYYHLANEISGGKNAEVFAHLGEFYARRNDFNASYQYLEKAQRLDVNNVGIHFNLGLAYANLGRNKEAVQQFDSVIALLGPEDETAKEADKIIKQLTTSNLNDPSYQEKTQSWQKITDEANNLSIKIPPSFVIERDENTGSFVITDRNPGSLGLNIQVLGRQVPENSAVEQFLQESPISMLGTLLDVQNVTFPPYRAAVQIYGTTQGDSQQRFILIKDDWVWQFKVYPGNSIKLDLSYNILSTFKPITE